MIIIWLNNIKEKSLDEFFSIIKRFDELTFVLEHEKEFYLFKIKERNLELKEKTFKKIYENNSIKDNLVIKILAKKVGENLVYTKLRIKKKENLIKKFKDTHAILFLYHE